jgi:peptidoglycan/LPS O-acetylase OafA/YrhL
MPALAPAVSLYLDAWRVVAALAVVLCHFSSRRMSGGLLWQLTPYGAQAVDVFFVLSGYVIAFAADSRETAAREFAIARMARLWSVAVPAAALTFALDCGGRLIMPPAYAHLPGAPDSLPVLWQATAGVLFFDSLWGAGIPVGANIPWWSLGYEVPLYLAFGLARFGGKITRVAGPVLVAAAAGPPIVVMAPIWVAGALVWRMHAAGRMGTPALALAAPVVWLGYEVWCWVFGRPLGILPHVRPEALQDLLVGFLFAAHLLAVPALLSRLPPCPAGVARTVRAAAGCSFAIYLMHYPVMLFLRAVMLRTFPDWTPLLLLPVTLAICVGLAGMTERRKYAWRRWIAWALEQPAQESAGGDVPSPPDPPSRL